MTFLRDGAGRITQIIDPAGNGLHYGYDAAGRLSSFTNRVGETTQFLYQDSRFPNYLTDILDPRGVQAIRTEYDEDGRILRQIDADGHPIEYAHDLDNFTERVTDRLGHTTTYIYDALGNVTRRIDPLGAETRFEYYPGTDLVRYETDDLGNVTARAYDAQQNLLVEITGASTAEDPLTATTGFITRYSYNAFSAPLSITDPNGNQTGFSYDAQGNLLGQTQYGAGDAALTTAFTYTSNGEIASITDAAGNVTRYSYATGIADASFPAAVKRQTVTVTDATHGVLRITESLYDAQENLLVERFDRTLPDGATETVQTAYTYDAENRLLATHLPDGSVAETRYNRIGQEAASIRWQSRADYQSEDLARARVTTMTYDDRGNRIRTDYPDGTTTTSEYDAEGRRVSSTNALGATTYTVYDALGRPIQTLHPDDSMPPDPTLLDTSARILNAAELADNPSERSVYDSIGRVEFSIDALGQFTQNLYDDACACAGRLQETRAYLTPDSWLSTTYAYDANGNQRFVTDPAGNRTEFVYDSYNRLVATHHPATAEHGATHTQTEYDALGRRSATVDEAGKRTEFRYDALGRLLEVRQQHPTEDWQSGTWQTTTYTYDQAGNRLSETDALGRSTRFEADAMGRRTRRILPGGEAEQYHINGWGELARRTDFNGHTTSYTYDAMSRLLTERADASAFPGEVGITHSYDALGRITTMVDASGTTSYTYDVRGNLLRQSNAVGSLTYRYDAANNLSATESDHGDGLQLSYNYDALNRLSRVTDHGATQPPPSTTTATMPTATSKP